MFISAECCDGDEGDLSFIDKKKTVKLQHGGLLFPFHTMPQNHPDSYKNIKYKYYDYTFHEKNAATFGYRRNPGMRLHAARDLYYNAGEPIFAITDGVVKRIADFYYDTWVIEIEHEYNYIKGYKLMVRYGEVKKETSILVKVGDTVERGQKIAEIGLLYDSKKKVECLHLL